MGNAKTWVVAVLLVFTVAVGYETVFPREAQAIPAFARKFNVACNTCHEPSFPKLNDFGNKFRDQGYQMGTSGDMPTDSGITMGYWPVSLRTTVGYQSDSVKVDQNQMTSGGLGFTGLDILSFGILTRNVSFGFVLTPALDGAGFQTGASTGNLEAAFIRLDNLERLIGGSDKDSYLLNLKVGRFELDVPFSEKRSPTLNTPFVMYHYMAGTPYAPHQSPANALRSYANPNDFSIGDNQNGLELAGYMNTPLNGTFRYSLAAVSNNTSAGGLQGGAGTGGRDLNFFGRVSQSVKGYGIVSGHRIGLFGASGVAPTQANTLCPACMGVGQDARHFDRIGVDASTTFMSQWNLFGAWMHSRDSQNLIASDLTNLYPRGARWNGAFVELDWSPPQLFSLPGMMLTYRHDLIRNERQGNEIDNLGNALSRNYNDVNSHTAMIRYNFHYSARTDITLHAEYNYTEVIGVGALGGDLSGKTALVGFDFAY